jgi:hypothetical protein
MAQHDYIIANGTGAAVRSDLNGSLAAIVSNNSGATQPTTMYAYQWWADTTTGLLKLRNAANNAWITLFQLDGEWSTLAIENGTAAAPSFYFKDSGTDTGLFSAGTDQVNIATAGVERVEFGNTEVVFNDGGADVDFRIEGDTNANLFKIDAGLDEVQVANLNGGQLAGTRNRVINGDMRIDQRNAGASVTPSNSYTLDRWKGTTSASSKYTIQQSSTAPTGFKNSLLVTSSSAYSLTASDFFVVGQSIEGFNIADLGWGAAGASSITISFWVRSSLTGNFGGSLRNSSYNRSYPFSYTILSANTFEYKTVTVAGDTTGTWSSDNSSGIEVLFSLGVGSTYSGTAGAWAGANYISATGATSVVGTSGATFYITGVQLEPGTVATPFERRSYGAELALCQRYFISQECNAVGHVQASVGAENMTINLPVLMRSAPTIAVSGSPTIFDGITGSNVITAIGINNSVSSALRFRPTYSGGSPFGSSGACVVSFNGLITASSEL